MNHIRLDSLDTAEPIQFWLRVRAAIRHHLSNNRTSSVPGLWNPTGSILSKIQTKHTLYPKRVGWATGDPCGKSVRKSSRIYSSKFDRDAVIRSCSERNLSTARSVDRLHRGSYRDLNIQMHIMLFVESL